MSNNQAQTFLASCLPNDEELIQREKTWLNIFDKFSIDEGSDAELDEENEQDSNTMSNVDSSNSDTSIVSNGEDNDNDYDIQTLADELKPAINERIVAWQEKGINFALQTFDPKAAVEMWLQANKECTTCTKTVTKTVISEDGKTTRKETRRTTTTKKAFRTIIRPHLIISNHQNQIDNDTQSITSVTQNSKDKAPSVDKTLDGNGLTHLKQTPISKEFSFKKPNAKIPTINVSEPQIQLRSRRVLKDKNRSSRKRQNKVEKATKSKNGKQKSHVMEMVSTPMEQQTDSAINSNPSSEILIHSPGHKQISGTNMLATNPDPQECIDRNNLRISDENNVPNAGMLINSRTHPPGINAIQTFDTNNSDSEEDDILMTSYRGPKSLVLYEPPTRNAIQSFNSNNSDSEEDDILMTSYKNLNCFMLVKL